jgi:anti-anti-sigma factor
VHNGLVVNNREEFKNRVLDLLADHTEVKRIVIDLGSASYVDTSGLGVLLRCTNLCRARGVHFVIRGVRDDLLEFWRQTNIDQGLELEHG